MHLELKGAHFGRTAPMVQRKGDIMAGPHQTAPLAAANRSPVQALIAVPQLPLATALARALLTRRILPALAFSTGEVTAYLELCAFAVLILHLQLERVDPARLLAEARRRSHATIVALGSEPLPPGEARALGCDRYAQHTLAPSALASEVARLSRPAGRSLGSMRIHQWGPLQLDPCRWDARWEGRPLPLTPTQFRMLLVMVQAAGAVVTPLELAGPVWGTQIGQDTERVVAHVRRIRQRIEPDPSHPRFLLSVRGVGFRLADAAALPPAPAIARRVTSMIIDVSPGSSDRPPLATNR
jgi:DNA-binding response OmpR family regulator